MVGPPQIPRGIPQDAGWSWMICVGAFVQNFVVQGVVKTLGVLLVEFRERFQGAGILNALTVALVAAGFFLFAGVANALGMMFGNRRVVMVGGTVSFLSMLSTAFAPNMGVVLFSLGLVSGVAYGTMFGPTLVTVAQYFGKRRALAMGISVSGGSIGQLILPILVTKLIGEYGFQGGIAILAAILLHAVPGAMLLRPLDFWAPRVKLLKLQSMREEQQALAQTAAAAADDTDEDATAVMLEESEKIKPADPSPPSPPSGPPQPPPKMGCGVFCRRLFDKDLVKNPVFLVVSLGFALAHSGYLCSVIFMPPFSLELFGSKQNAALLVSIMGGCDLAGRLFGGWFADLGVVKMSDIMAFSLGIPGIVGVIFVLMPEFWMAAIFAVVLGALAGTYTALTVPLLAATFGLAKVPSGFGMACIFMGVLLIPMPTVLGITTKMTGSFKTSMFICAILLICSGATFIMMRFVERKVAAKVKKQAASSKSPNYDIEHVGKALAETKESDL